MRLRDFFKVNEDSALMTVTLFIDVDRIDWSFEDHADEFGVSVDIGWEDLHGNSLFRLQGSKEAIVQLVQRFRGNPKRLFTGPVQRTRDDGPDVDVDPSVQKRFDFD